MNGRAINVPFDLRRGTRNSAKYYQQFYGAFLHDGLPYDAMSFATFNLSFWHVLPSPFSHCVSIRLGDSGEMSPRQFLRSPQRWSSPSNRSFSENRGARDRAQVVRSQVVSNKVGPVARIGMPDTVHHHTATTGINTPRLRPITQPLRVNKLQALPRDGR